jgi:ParB family transcriptional regulator, chromosome partitioning protein
MVKRAQAKKRPRKAKPGTKGLAPAECRLTEPSEAVAEVTEAIEKAGGCAVGAYKDPLGGHPVLIAILPIDAVEPTPFQRDLSDAHHKRLADVINKTGRFLDPIIAVVAPRDGFWTPNGRHRLEAMRRLGAKSISALVVADREVAWQILALNTEKAHNLKERALEVIRIYRGLVDEDASGRNRRSPSILTKRLWSRSVSAMNGRHALVAECITPYCVGWKPSRMSRCGAQLRITRSDRGWCLTWKRRLPQW